jgi:SagB-type dehydrogenase family enzyme
MTEPGNSPDIALANAAAAANSFKTVAPWARATGFRTQELKLRALGGLPECRVAEEFLLNSQFARSSRESEASIQEYFSDSSVVMLSLAGQQVAPPGRSIALPESIELNMALGDVLGARRSTRAYTGDSLRLDYFATLLRSAAGVTAHGDVVLAHGERRTLSFRAAPSAGGLYPITLFALALDVQGLERGAYVYDPQADRLIPSGGADQVERCLSGFCVPDEMISISRANAVFLFVAQPWRSMRKYGPRGLRFVFMEVGSMAENVHLATAALGFGSVDCASFYESELHAALGIDGVFQTMLHSIVIGCPG